ncbi:MAG TPA: XdhC/CoxI family protein [Symbiobacteriaceae bacterium]|jgi:xanthine dehydrogenase accessory factor|nr:XdhC/CoxI family protein [Symbiobacteriaceae bacterium]
MQQHWRDLANAVRGNHRVCRVVVIEGSPMGTFLVVDPAGTAPISDVDLARLASEVLTEGRPRAAQVGPLRVYAEPLLPPPQVLIAGGGHVALALAPAAFAAGFSVTVVDDRPDYATPARFPDATVLCENMAAALDRLPTGDATFIVLAGRTHELDRDALRVALQKPAAYVGMVGSRRKVAELQRQLGLSAAALERLRAPIGLDLGAETPAEIAVAIVAEMITVRRGCSGAPLSHGHRPSSRRIPCGTVEAQQVWLALADALDSGTPCALATIVQANGSTPRSAGTCMLVRDGAPPVGTVGGGKWEAEVQRQAAAAWLTGRPAVLRPSYADEADMVCGGSSEILIEPVVTQ